MSRGFVKEGDQEETPIVTPRAVLPDGTPNYVTPTGLELLKQERETLVSEQEANKDNRIQYNYLTAVILFHSLTPFLYIVVLSLVYQFLGRNANKFFFRESKQKEAEG